MKFMIAMFTTYFALSAIMLAGFGFLVYKVLHHFGIL